MQPIRVTHFTDPGCPWAYSAAPAAGGPALALRRPARLGPRDHRPHRGARQYADRGYTPRMMAGGYLTFRARWGMPFATAPKPRVAATSRACRAIVVARGQDPALGDAALRVLQLLQFTTPLPLDDDDALRPALQAVVGLDADATVGALDDDDVVAAYEADRGRARTAEDGPTRLAGQGRELRRALALHRARRSSSPAARRAWRRAASSRWRPTTSCWRTSARAWSGATRPATCARRSPPSRWGSPPPRRPRCCAAATTRPTCSPPEAGARRRGRRRARRCAWRPAATRLWLAPRYAEGPESRLSARAIAALSGVAPALAARS